MQQLELVPYLLYEKEDNGILWIKFNRPEKLNAAVGGPERNGTLSKVGEYMRAGDDDPEVKAIVLTGIGRGFCAGVDIRGSDLGQFEPNDNFLGNAPYEAGGLDATRQGFYHGMTKLMKDISFIRKPTIAMVNGVAAGLGMDMALQCDIRYGSEPHALHLLPPGGPDHRARRRLLPHEARRPWSRTRVLVHGPARWQDCRGVGRPQQDRAVLRTSRRRCVRCAIASCATRRWSPGSTSG